MVLHGLSPNDLSWLEIGEGVECGGRFTTLSFRWYLPDSILVQFHLLLLWLRQLLPRPMLLPLDRFSTASPSTWIAHTVCSFRSLLFVYVWQWEYQQYISSWVLVPRFDEVHWDWHSVHRGQLFLVPIQLVRTNVQQERVMSHTCYCKSWRFFACNVALCQRSIVRYRFQFVLFFVSYLGLDIIVFVDSFRQGKVELDNKARDDNYNDMDRMKEKWDLSVRL